MAGRYDASMFIKRAPPNKMRKLYELLSINGEPSPWKLLVGQIYSRRDPTKLRFGIDDVKTFERAKVPAEALIESWSTDRPKLGQLRDALAQAGLYREADYVSINILSEGPVPRLPEHTFTATQEIATAMLGQSRERGSEASSRTVTSPSTVDSDRTITNTDYPHHYSYRELEQWSNNFNKMPVKQNGNFLGSGGFGDVFLGRPPNGSCLVAIKKLDMTKSLEKIVKQFSAEVKTLSCYIHENLLALIGYSDDMNNCCIVYEYLPNGSVERRLACKDNTPPLTVAQRIHIAQGTARGIHHLHTFRETPLIHRDIKTANILLDAFLNAKVGDFGLARPGRMEPGKTHDTTLQIIGTTVYMAIEYLQRGKLSEKTDAYSYGVVLLELLTGLPAVDYEKPDGEDIITLMENLDGPLTEVLDWKAGDWPPDTAQAMYELAMVREGNFMEKYDKRSTISQVLPEIEQWKA